MKFQANHATYLSNQQKYTKINTPGVSFADALTDSPNDESLFSDILIPGLVLDPVAKGAHLRLFAGIWVIDSHS